MVVLVTPWTKADWQDLTMRSRAILRSAGVYDKGAEVEFLPGESSENVCQELEGHNLDIYCIKPGLGASTGLKVSKSRSGTIEDSSISKPVERFTRS